MIHIGSGSRSNVYAKDDIVVKQIKGKYFEYAVTEVAFIHSIDHPNIIKFLDVKFNKPIEIKMKKYDTLTDKKNHLGIFKTIKIIHGLINAVYFLHQNNIVHCDIKLENILLDNYCAILADFDMANIANIEGRNPTVYTISYRAPEVNIHERAKYTNKIDVWAVGVFMFELICKCNFYTSKYSCYTGGITDIYTIGNYMKFHKNIAHSFGLDDLSDQKAIDENIARKIKDKIKPEEYSEYCGKGIIQMIIDCLQVDPEKRCDMGSLKSRIDKIHDFGPEYNHAIANAKFRPFAEIVEADNLHIMSHYNEIFNKKYDDIILCLAQELYFRNVDKDIFNNYCCDKCVNKITCDNCKDDIRDKTKKYKLYILFCCVAISYYIITCDYYIMNKLNDVYGTVDDAKNLFISELEHDKMFCPIYGAKK